MEFVTLLPANTMCSIVLRKEQIGTQITNRKTHSEGKTHQKVGGGF